MVIFISNPTTVEVVWRLCWEFDNVVSRPYIVRMRHTVLYRESSLFAKIVLELLYISSINYVTIFYNYTSVLILLFSSSMIVFTAVFSVSSLFSLFVIVLSSSALSELPCTPGLDLLCS